MNEEEQSLKGTFRLAVLPTIAPYLLPRFLQQLSEKHRAGLRPVIEREALAWAVASVDNHEIDKINILNASILAMHRALDQLKVSPGHIIVDGNRF